MIYAMIWINLDHIVLSKITEPQKGLCHMITLTSLFKVIRATERQQNKGFQCSEHGGEFFSNDQRVRGFTR